MSFDLYPDEVQAARNGGVLMDRPDPGLWAGGFDLTMQGLAKTARAVDLAGAVPPIILDKLTGGTERQDTYFREHDEVFNRAVDYWTPEPGTVGKAGQIVGSLVPTLASVLINPGLAVGTAGLGTGEDLIREGVPAKTAISAAVAQAVGTGVGVYMPIFGSTWATRALVAGAGANIVQGIATKAVMQQILKGEKSADQYKPWELEGIVLDALMGIGFGTIVHLGAKMQDAQAAMTQTDRDAVLVAQQARHMEDTTLPGRPVDEVSRAAHVEAVKQAADDLLAGRQPNVDQIVQGARFAPDQARDAIATDIRDSVVAQARQTVLDAIKAEQARTTAAETPGFLRTADDLVALKAQDVRELAPDLQRAVDIAKKPGALRTAEERIFLKDALEGHAFDALTKPIEPLVREAKPIEGEAAATTKAGDTGGDKGGPGAPDPLLTEAHQRLSEHGDRPVTLMDESGREVTKTANEWMADHAKMVETAKADAGLFQTAAACMLGAL